MNMKKVISALVLLTFSLQNISFAVDFPLSKVSLDKDYYISPMDTLKINVSPAEEFSREVMVQADGTVDLPLIGSMEVSGMKVKDFEKILEKKYSKYISNPDITVTIKKFSAYRVALIGEIKTPGYYEFNEGMKLLDLIAIAGGPNPYADSRRIKVYRRTKDKEGKIKEEIFSLSMESFFEGELDKNINLQPGDIVYIPQKKFTATSKWITDNIIPWTMLTTFAISIGIILGK